MINSELLNIQGLKAQELSKEAAAINKNILNQEEAILEKMEKIEVLSSELSQLKN